MIRILEILFLAVLVFLAAFTAASETSITAVSRLRLKRLASTGSKTASIILKILETPDKFFGTILVANNIVDILIASLVTGLMIHLLADEARGIFVATVIVTILIIVSEVAAKTFAARHSERISLAMAAPVEFFIFLFSPVVKVLAVITNGIVKLLGGDIKGKRSLVTEDEIRWLMKIGEEEGVLHKEKYKMLSKVFDFSEAIVKSVMKPKSEIVAIDISANLEDTLDRVLESGYSRLPVYKDSPDNIIGIINMKDLLTLEVNKGLVVLQDIVYPATFVQESKKITELLKEFQKGHTHLAIVIDQDKKIKGLVTIEDILEEIVGEIEDEFDVRATYYKNNEIS